jgi:hypothetical protein
MFDSEYIKKVTEKVHDWSRRNDPNYAKQMKQMDKYYKKKELQRKQSDLINNMIEYNKNYNKKQQTTNNSLNNNTFDDFDEYIIQQRLAEIDIETMRIKDDNITAKTYIVGAKNKDYVKIGTTKNISRRLGQLNTSTPDKLELIYWTCTDSSIWFNRPEFEEKALHGLCKEYHINKEWYHKDVVEFINSKYEF